MRKIYRLIAFAALLAAFTGCQLEDADIKLGYGEKMEAGFDFVQERPRDIDTKTVINAANFESKFTTITYGAYSGGKLYRSAYYADLVNGALNTANTTIALEKGFTFTVYAFVNMGDLTGSLPNNESGVANMVYTIPAYNNSTVSDVNTRGIPMSGSITLTPADDIENKTITLRRLLAKVTAELTCEWDGARIQSAKVYNLNSKLKPFGTSAASTAGDMLSFQEVAAGSDATTLTAVFYVPENMQGVYSGITLSGNKSQDNALISGIAGRLTYLETVVSSTGRYEGTVVYRSYLGGNATSNFNIERNSHYHWTINYKSEKVDDYDNDWKHDMDDGGGLTVRRYTMSLAPNPGELAVGATMGYTTTLNTITENPTSSSSSSILTNGSCDQWVSSNPSVATVNGNGVVTGVSAGTTTITAKYTPSGYDFSQIQASATLTVSDVVTHYMEIIGGDSPVAVGTPISLVAKYHTIINGSDDGGVVVTTDPSASWTRTDGSNKISVGAHTGQVSATSPGNTSSISATIRCTYAGVYAEKTVTFNPVVSYRLAISASPSATVDMGNPIQMGARFFTTIDGVEDSGVDVTSSTVWSKSSGGASVTVSSSGAVTSSSAATAVVSGTYTHEGTPYNKTMTVTFNHVAAITHSLTITGSTSANVGTNINLTATYRTFSDGVEQSAVDVTSASGIAWSKKSGFAQISVGAATGIVSCTNTSGASGAKTGVIIATYQGCTAPDFTVTFNPVVSHQLLVTATPTTANVGETIQMSARYKTTIDNVDSYEDVSAGNVTWSPSTGTIKVNTSGQVSASAGGTQTITGTYSGQSGSASVTFNNVVTHDLVVSCSGSTSVNVGQTINLTATYRTFTNGSVSNTQDVTTNASATWARQSGSDKVSVGTHTGAVTAASPGGSAVIRCTYSGVYDQINVSFGSVVTKRIEVYASPSASVNWNQTITMSAKVFTTTDGSEDSGVVINSGLTWSKVSGDSSISVNSSTGAVTCNANPASSVTAVVRGSYNDGSNVYNAQLTVTFNHVVVVTHTLVITGSSSSSVGTPINLTATYYTFNDGTQSASSNVTTSATWSRKSGSTNVSVGAGNGVVTAVSPGGSAVISATYSGTTSNDFNVSFGSVVVYSVEVSASPATANVGQTITMSARLKTVTDGGTPVYTNLSNSNVTWSPSSGTIQVNTSGQVTASAGGTQTITGTYMTPDGNRSGTASVTFNDVVTHYLEIVPTTATERNVGQPIGLKAMYHTVTNNSDDGGVDKTASATWTKVSGFTYIAVSAGSVTCNNPDGVAGAKTATIRATYSGESDDQAVTFNPVVTKRLAVTATPAAQDYPGTIQMSSKLYVSYDGVEDGGTTVTGSTGWAKSSEDGGTSYISVNGSGVVSCSTNPATSKSAVIQGTYNDGVTNYSNTATVVFNHQNVDTYTLTITGDSEANVGTPISLTATYKHYVDNNEVSSVDVTTASGVAWSMESNPSGLISVGSSTGVVSCTNPSGVAGDKTGTVKVTYAGKTALKVVTFHPVVSKQLVVSASPASAPYNQTIQMSAQLKTTTDGNLVTEPVSAGSVTWTRLSSGTNNTRISVNSSGVVSYSGNASGGATGTIQGSYSGATGTAGVTFTDVVSHRLAVSAVSGLSATVGQKINLTATYYTTTNGVEDSGTNVTLNSGTTWSPSSGTIKVAKGSTYAEVTATADGSQAITATYQGCSDSKTVSFSSSIVKELVVSASPASQTKGNTIQLSAQLKTTVNGGTPTYQDISASQVAWTALSTGTAGNYSNISVNASGVVSYSGTSSGTSRRDIQGTYDGATGSVNVTFTDLVTYTFDITPSTSTGNTVGNNVSLTAKYYIVTNGVPDSGHIPSSGVSWGSSNGNMTVSPASGSGNATVSAVTGGTTTISASYITPGGLRNAPPATVTFDDVITYQYEATVSTSSSSVVTTGALNVGVQKPAYMKLIRKKYVNNVYQSGQDQVTDVSTSATWTSSNTGVASIVSTRYVNGVAVGNATITGSIANPNGGANLTGTILVSVYPPGFNIGGGWDEGGTIDL